MKMIMLIISMIERCEMPSFTKMLSSMITHLDLVLLPFTLDDYFPDSSRNQSVTFFFLLLFMVGFFN